jgi:hypothetical protein
MARSKKGTLVPSCDERTRRIFYLHWQFLRRSEHYKDAAEECLRNLQALYDQLITQQQTLAPPPALSTPASALATKIDGLLRHSRPRTFLAIHPPRLEEKRPLLFDFPIGGFSPPEGRLARGFKPPAFSRFLFQSAVKSAESF